LARLDPVKGHKIAIEALSEIKEHFPDIKLKIAGREENTSTDELLTYARKLNVSDNIEFLGYVQDKHKFMRGCTLGIIPSTGSEAVSRAAIEWISQSKLVIGSNVGGISDIINDKNGILVEPSNPKKLANAIVELLLDKERYLTMSKQARKIYLENFTVEIFLKKTTDFYNKIKNGVKK
jgi:glycosyltransferase involved in cell wall biosynthesis